MTRSSYDAALQARLHVPGAVTARWLGGGRRGASKAGGTGAVDPCSAARLGSGVSAPTQGVVVVFGVQSPGPARRGPAPDAGGALRAGGAPTGVPGPEPHTRAGHLAGAASGAPCHRCRAVGLLPVQQRGRGRGVREAGAGRGASGGRGLGRAPRQWHVRRVCRRSRRAGGRPARGVGRLPRLPCWSGGNGEGARHGGHRQHPTPTCASSRGPTTAHSWRRAVGGRGATTRLVLLPSPVRASAETCPGSGPSLPRTGGAGHAQLQRVWLAVVEPALRRFRPALLLVSAGFDAHREDPFGLLRYETASYAWLAQRVDRLAEELCGATRGGDKGRTPTGSMCCRVGDLLPTPARQPGIEPCQGPACLGGRLPNSKPAFTPESKARALVRAPRPPCHSMFCQVASWWCAWKEGTTRQRRPSRWLRW